MATELVYLTDFDIVQCTARVTSSQETQDDQIDLQLDKTCFYPRGGGQDWDEGWIEGADGAAVFRVHKVRLDENGIVHHIGRSTAGELNKGDAVNCTVDANRRTINTRLHSAGHVIDM